jgi:hypothetical protein
MESVVQQMMEKTMPQAMESLAQQNRMPTTAAPGTNIFIGGYAAYCPCPCPAPYPASLLSQIDPQKLRQLQAKIGHDNQDQLSNELERRIRTKAIDDWLQELNLDGKSK